jgi:hypothetical protein
LTKIESKRNVKVIVILSLTLAAIVILALYTFGPLSHFRTNRRANPESLKPAGSETVKVNGGEMTLRQYHNRDMTENYYSVKIPEEFTVGPDGSSPGRYIVDSPLAKGTIRLMDVPDNTSLELYVLGQEEPGLSKSVPGYRKLGFEPITVNGVDAYELSYGGTDKGTGYRTVRVYIAGPDQAAVITLTSKEGDFGMEAPVFSQIINSYRWENR